MSRLVAAYANLPLGAVDASVIAIAERLNTPEVATLDRRHFTVVRPHHTHSLLLLPEKTLRTTASGAAGQAWRARAASV